MEPTPKVPAVIRTLIYFFTLAVLLFPKSSLPAAADVAPDTLVKSTVDEVLAAIRENKDRQALLQLAEKKVLPHFDFKRMTQLAVGAAWRQAGPAQQQALENGFRTLLVNTYTNALNVSATGKRTVEVKPAKSDQGEVTVKTLVKEAGKQPISIDYRMAKSPDGWKVYDIVAEDVSLVMNYRGSFTAEINRSGIDGLIKVLDEKNRTLAKG